MPTNLTALTSALALIADAAKDTVLALVPGQSVLSELLDYENLIADLENLVPQIGQIPTEVSQMVPEDYLTLTQTFVTDLAITNEKAQTIIAASLQLLNDLVLKVLPDVEALVAAVKE